MFKKSAGIYIYKSSYEHHLNQNIDIRTCTVDSGKKISSSIYLNNHGSYIYMYCICVAYRLREVLLRQYLIRNEFPVHPIYAKDLFSMINRN